MRVLKIIHTLGHGGAENTFRWLAWGLRREGVDVIAAISELGDSSTENWIAPALRNVDVPYITFDNSGGPLQLLRNISVLIARVKPDIVHSHLLDSNFYSAVACCWHSVPLVCTEHGDVSLKQSAISRFKNRVIAHCSNSVVCVSDAVRERVRSIVPGKEKLEVIHNGIHFMEKSCTSFRVESGIPEDAILIGNVGNLYPVKGQRYLVKAFSELVRTSPVDVYLVLVGRGGEQKSLQSLVRELGVPEGRVLFTGFRDDIQNILNALDLYVQPSLSEGHPIAILEAMSLAIPVIATAVGGVPEIIGPERFGTLVAPESWEDLHHAICDYLSQRKCFHERASSARTYVRQVFSIENMACKYVGVYRNVLSLQGAHRRKGGMVN